MKIEPIEGIVAVRGRGIGFVTLPDHDEDILISSENLGMALDGDLIELELLKKIPKRRQEGKLIRIINRKHNELIGTIKKDSKTNKTYFEPDNSRIHLPLTLLDPTPDQLGMKVVVELKYPQSPWQTPGVQSTEVIGKAGEHETEMQAIIRNGGFSENFPAQVSAKANEIHTKQDEIFKAALADEKRRDLRNITTFTIDPHDAKDFDDALSFQVLENGNFEVGVHIADVSHYVKEGEAIDTEARERGTSVYLVDRVIPMLPEVLSNDLCSLRPNEDRLAFSAVFELDNEAKVVSTWYGQTVIHSDHRFSYEDAQTVIDKKSGVYLTELSELMRLSRKLRKRRYQAGAIAFEQAEVKFELDENGKPIRVYAKERTETMLMIEDFMLLANQQVATHIHDLAKSQNKDAAFVYRIHDTPDPDKIEELAIFINALGYEFNTHKGIVKATDINKLLKEIEGKPEENLIKTATIRSMAKAIYSTKNIGHFGLAFRFYTHFTSPIRRYPDLMVHRLLRKHLDNASISQKEMAIYERLSMQCSAREVEAVRSERDSIKYKQIEFMLDKVGQEFDGIITGVTDWGIYVEEKESKAEGMVRLASLKDDYYSHHASKYEVKGEGKGRKFRLGDVVKIKLTNANLEDRQIDYELI